MTFRFLIPALAIAAIASGSAFAGPGAELPAEQHRGGDRAPVMLTTGAVAPINQRILYWPPPPR